MPNEPESFDNGVAAISTAGRKKRLLLISQVYVPDPAAVGQYMADAAEDMAARGWEVSVLTAARGYDNPEEKFPSHEERNGVSIRRLPFSSIGKRTIIHRLVGQLSFCVQVFLRVLFGRKPDCLLVTTSPPMGGAVAAALSFCRRLRICYWVMDINPDQAVVMGKVKPSALVVRIFDAFNRLLLKRAADVVALDRFMAQTMERKLPQAREKLHVMPLWPMEGYLEQIDHAHNPFRKAHGLEGKRVVMYSGNHSLVHPLDTVLEAALRLQDNERLVFVFVGGGLGKQAVDKAISEHGARNIISLPYQPLEQIKYSLSAADVHLVSMGAPMVGIVHPCKFYGAMALSRPIVLLGAKPCAIADIIDEHGCGWQIEHGDVEAAVQLFDEISRLPQEALDNRGARGLAAVGQSLSKDVLCARFSDVLEGKRAVDASAAR